MVVDVLYKRVIALVLAFSLVVVPAVAQETGSAEQEGGYLQGRTDGDRDAKGSAAWILAGLTGTGFCLCIGCVGVGLAYAIAPSPPAQGLLGKSAQYVQGYTEAYKNKARKANAGYAAAGCATAAVINIIINIATGNFPPKLPSY